MYTNRTFIREFASGREVGRGAECPEAVPTAVTPTVQETGCGTESGQAL